MGIRCSAAISAHREPPGAKKDWEVQKTPGWNILQVSFLLFKTHLNCGRSCKAMASKRKSTTPCMIPLKSMHMQEEVEPEGDPPDCLSHPGKDSSSLSVEETCEQGSQDVVDPSRPDWGNAQEELGTYICRPCGYESQDLNLFLDHVYSGHADFRAEPSFYCVDCGVSTAKFEGLALHNARAHPSTAATTLQVRRRDRRLTVEQSLVVSEGSKESEISITKTPIMKMLKGKSEPKRIVVSHTAEEPTLDSVPNREAEKKDTPAVTHVPTIVHNGAPGKVTIPSAIQIVNSSGTLPVLKTAITQVVSMVQNRTLHQQAPITASTSTSTSSSRNLPKVMIPLSSIPTYNSAMDTNSFLKTSFSKFPYPTKAELCYLTVVTKYPEEQIKIWFTAQRLKQGISWSPEEIEDARRKMFNTIIQTAPPTPYQQQQRHGHHNPSQHTITVLPASLGPSGIPQILQGSLVGQGGVIVTQPVMANGIQVSSAPVALAVTPKPQAAAKPLMQARPAAALVADKGASMVVGTVGSSSSGSTIITSSTAGSVISSNSISRNTSVISISVGSSSNNCNTNGNNNSKSNSSGNKNSSTTSTGSSSISSKGTDVQSPAASISHSSRTLPSSFLDPSFYKNKKSQEQLSALKQSFIRCQFPGQEEVERLTKITGLTVREVRKWFSDRRYHYRNLKGSRSGVGGLFSGNSLLDLADSPSSSESPKPNQYAQSPPRQQQQQQQMSPPTPARRAPRQQTPDFTAIRYKERDPQQVRALEASFAQDPSPSEEEVDRLRTETKMTRREIDGWFSERRKKAAAEKKKEAAEKAEEDSLVEKDVEANCSVEDPSQTSQQHVKGEKHKDEASCSTPKVNPIKINLKMLKVTESNGKAEPDSSQSARVESQTTPPPATSSSIHGKDSPDPVHLLKQFFVRARWPSSTQYDDLSAKTGLPRAEVVRWFGDTRQGHKNGQLKWLESYQQMAEGREDHEKAETKVLKAHLSLHGKLEEEHVKGLVESSGLSEEKVRRWFATRVPSLLESEVAATAEPGQEDQRVVEEQQQNEVTTGVVVLNNDSALATNSQSVNPKQGTD
ncbi:hypothetical protein SKAU_G00106460 [Synaphobranchus kaupii]|uniref:Homeobox domain-containing protein n=1 Tax=Synaphobranchus kaupii TaxID=118154 RepID=A0A9Q1G0C3_SYNKA|nr:hypothetical protein SKAU_G00106460 [Synaphobranchus kaupii]